MVRESSIRQRRYRIRWIGTPNLSFFHDLSAVYTGALRTIPRARQAWSPNDKPSGRVLVIRFPAASACSAVKAVASRNGAECCLPCIAWGQPQAYKFALYFGEID